MNKTALQQPKMYKQRDPQSSPLYQLVINHFDEFERVYPQRFEKHYGFWRPIIRQSIEKFLRCGDLKEGFARVRCDDCGETYLLAFSCKQRCCCPSCDQKRSLVLGHRLEQEVLEPVPHRQWVFTIPKRLRIYFRFDHSLLGDLCRLAYDTLRESYCSAIEEYDISIGMIASIQSFGSLINFHPHIHVICSDGVFLQNGHFVNIPDLDLNKCIDLWKQKVFYFLKNESKIDDQIINSIKQWKHSGFSIDNSVRIDQNDHESMQRLIEYISRCPFSLGRIIKITPDVGCHYILHQKLSFKSTSL